jgi:hypothetical protein
MLLEDKLSIHNCRIILKALFNMKENIVLWDTMWKKHCFFLIRHRLTYFRANEPRVTAD